MLNAQLWKDLVKAIRAIARKVEFHWVKGHKSDPRNKTVDKMAKHSAKGATRPPLTLVSVRRKKTRERVQPGVVDIAGQRLPIRVITCEFLKVQKVWRYSYEVVSRRSPVFGKVDWVHSSEDLLLRDGHSYQVRLNDDNPQDSAGGEGLMLPVLFSVVSTLA